jgi:hypothetical protein
LRVFGSFRQREIGELGHEDIGAQRGGDLFFQRIEIVQIRRENHEAQIGPGQHRKRDHRGLLLRAGVVDQLLQPGECRLALGFGARVPRGEVDPVEKMQGAESLGRSQGGGWAGLGR